ncbi:hypothetical protein SISNIDRAFT_453886 [Sistotremastrum niveocremeum HHB9708]|uniref:Fungal-type protein kinase domain-containing protein n=1 Tax=Sistotremastrum niveocremeum HHB9708 TaxID=1314777 RepID=A0A164VHH3_9AGAM|nr:hypothetical protein SISNIDRAFT_453886 [Sistotremastrum niveocremeum HHB9708]
MESSIYLPLEPASHSSADDLEAANWVLLWVVLVRIPAKHWVRTPQELWKQNLSENDAGLNLDGKKVMHVDILHWGPPITFIGRRFRPSEAMLPFAALLSQLFTITDRATREVESLLEKDAESPGPSASTIMEISRKHYNEWLEIISNPTFVLPDRW